MSVSLWINWANGSPEEIAIGSLRVAEWWAEEGRELGLKLVPLFYSFIPVEAENLDRLIREVSIFRDAMAQRGEEYHDTVVVAERLIDAFHRLKGARGWEASIG